MTPKSNSNTDPASSLGLTLKDIQDERLQQDEQWGEQNHPDGTGLAEDDSRADRMKHLNDFYVREDTLTWRDILLEEVYEVFAETHPVRLREELVQVAAVAVAWIEAIDRRSS